MGAKPQAPEISKIERIYIMFNEKNTNKTFKRTVNENINTKDLPFVRLADLVGRDIQIFGYFFTNGDYGKQIVAVSEDYNINLPNRYLKQFESWSDEERETIINGGLTLANIREYTGKNGKTTYVFDYADTI